MGGIGKTQLALEYAYRCVESYQSILWLQAETRELLWADLAALADALHLVAREGQSSRERIEAVQRWLQEHSSWLLIVDNLADLGLLQEFLPPTPRGHILLTTRIQATGPEIEGLVLEKMPLEEGALLLLRRTKRLGLTDSLEQASFPDRRMAATLVDLLDGLPLALDQAGAYIEEAACDLAHYVALFQHRRAVLLGLRTLSGYSSADHPRSVRATLALSLERLQREHPAALALLQCCAFLHPEAIPEELFQEGAPEPDSPLVDLVCDALQMDTAVADLRRYSLLQRDPVAHTLSLHRLVQVVVQDTLSEAAQCRWAERVVCLVERAFPQQVDYANWERCQRLLPHALACAGLIKQWGFSSLEAARLLHGAAHYLRKRGAYSEALPFYEQALAMREQALGARHPMVAESLNDLAVLYFEQGHYEESLPLFQRALAMREQTLGPIHPDVATSLNNLARLSQKQGRSEEALPLHQRALSIREQTLGPTHPDVAGSLNNLAMLSHEQGRSEEALPLFQRALAMREQTLGPTHPEVATSLNNLAVLSHDQGQYQEALPLYQRALAIWERALGPTHPKVVGCLEQYAALLRALQQPAQAEVLEARARAIHTSNRSPT